MKKILYIANPKSIHDIKWASYFPNDQTKIYFCYERQNAVEDYWQLKEKLVKYNIHLLPPIESFSLIKPNKFIYGIIKLKRYIKTYKIDLVHALFATPHAFWALFLSKPFIITTRGSDILVVIPELLKINGLRTIYNKLLFSLLKLSFRHAKHITGTSLKQIDKAIELFNVKNTSLIRTGIAVEKMLCSNHEKHLPKELKNKKFIFCPRFLQPIYRNEMVVEAFNNLPSELKNDLTLVFILGQKELPDYKSKIVELLKNNHVDFVILNYLSQEALWATFYFAKLAVMTPASDGTPNSALEAMALKSPLIMGNLPYDSDLFEGTCLKMESELIAELTSLIQIAIEDYPQNLIKEAFKRVNKHGNRDIEMMKLKKIYFD